MNDPGPSGSPSARRTTVWSRCLLALTLLAGCGGCDEMRQLFDKTFLDPSGVIGLESRRSQLRESISFYDQPAGGMPENAEDPTTDDLAVRRQDYRVGPGDLLEVQVFELVDVGTATPVRPRVSDSGRIALPRIGSLYVEGMTEQEIEKLVGSAYRDAGILQDPQISVVAQTRISQTFSVIGSFSSPGTYNILSPDFRLLNALGLVGGVSNTTLKWIHVIRAQRQAPLPPATGGPTAVPPTGDTGPGVQPLLPPGGVEPTPPGGQPLMLPESTNGQTGQPATEGPTPPAAPGPDPREEELRSLQPGAVPPGLTNGAMDALADGGEPSADASPPPAGPYAGQGYWTYSKADRQWQYVAGPAAADEDASGPKTRVIRIDLEPLRNGVSRWNIVIRDKDVLVAAPPVIGEFYMMGNVNRPGVYSLTNRQITLTQAVAAAGGLGPLAIPSRVQLIRRIGNSQQETVVVDIGRIIECKDPDYLLKPDDVVNVGTAVYAPFLAVIRNAFRATYGVGFVYDRNFADIDSYGSRPNPHN